MVLVVAAFAATIIISLQSLERYETRNTVVAIELDHYYWNTTFPSFTICPVVNRITKELFDKYCKKNGLNGTRKSEFNKFIESMANATYETFDQIKDFESIEVNQFDFILFYLSAINKLFFV